MLTLIMTSHAENARHTTVALMPSVVFDSLKFQFSANQTTNQNKNKIKIFCVCIFGSIPGDRARKASSAGVPFNIQITSHILIFVCHASFAHGPL